MCRCRRSRSRCAWVRAKGRRNSGSPASNRGASYSRSTAFRRRWRARRLDSPLPSCRSRRASSSASRSRIVMKPDDLRAMTVDQLDDEVLKLKKERFNLRFQRATGQLENTARVRQVRRDIARIKTIAAEKRSGPQSTAPATAPREKPAAKPKKRAARSKAKAE